MSPRKYDVCMLVQSNFKNHARVLKEARSLARQGLKVNLLALHHPGTERREYVHGFWVQRLPVWSRVFRGRWFLGLKAAEFIARLLWSALASRSHVYHAHHPVTLLPAVIAAKLRRAKVVYDIHELHFALPEQTPFQRRLVRWYEGVLVRLVDGVIMSDGASRTEAFRAAHDYHKPIHYVYNCAAAVEVAGNEKDLHRELGIPATHHLVVYTGLIGTFRGVDQTIESMSRWPPSAHFVMIGPRTEAEERRLMALAAEHHVGERVHMWGPVPPDEVALWAACATTSVVLIQNTSLSYYYSAPTKMFETIMARVPQVSSDFPEIRRVVRENPVGPVGEVVPPADPQAIGEAVCRIIEDEALRQAYRRNADVLARTLYHWGTQEKVLVDLYQELLR